MIKECLVCSSMRLGVPFIAPRQLGVVESNPGRQFLPSVGWCTGQSGAPPDTVRCWLLSYSGVADCWRFGAIGAPDTVRCTPDTPVPPSDRWLGHASRADCAADRWRGRSLAHRRVRWFLAVRRRWNPESGLFTRASLAHRTVWCTQTAESWLLQPSLFLFLFSLILALRQNMLVHKNQCIKSRIIPFCWFALLPSFGIVSHLNHLCWHLITKILRNGPRAHFPFNWCPPLVNSLLQTFGKASTFDMPPKKAMVPGSALQPLDTNQDALSLREARIQKRKATSPTLQEE
jgi:hypothetical protein